MFPQLETERLWLREVTDDDQAFIFEGLSHPEVIPFYGVRYNSFEAAKVQMDWYQTIYREGTGISWKLVHKQTRENIGDISVYFYKPEHRKAEVGFWLLPNFWNQGYAREALHVVIDYWKTEKVLHRMEAFVEDGNTASSNLLEKAGFQYEGKMIDCEIKDGRFISLLIYALIIE
jgi:[ribosomal protein S5]-alanine N-acetyltransferase